MAEGFLLGLSTGVVCVAYCGPALLPYLMAESGGLRKSILFVAVFLAGRLTAYLITAVVAGMIGQTFLKDSGTRTILMSIAYMLLAIMLIIYGFYRFREICLGTTARSIVKPGKNKTANRIIVPYTAGFLTGINICPPFLLAITGAVDSGSITGSILFFLAFFAGTSVFFIPMPFAGIFMRQQVIRITGKFAALLAGIIYFYKGLVLLISHIQA
jgi:sulfite exporter TauE/SafE